MSNRWLNRTINGAHILVERALTGVKRCKTAKAILRNTELLFSELAKDVTCALDDLGRECYNRAKFLPARIFSLISIAEEFN